MAGLGRHKRHSRVRAGDVSGDGFADLIVGAAAADPNGSGSGASYVVFGKPSGFPASFDLASLNGANGFKISGEAAGDYSGVVSGGDINGDGFADFLVGAPNADPNGIDSGASYVVFGHAAATLTDVPRTRMTSTTTVGLTFFGRTQPARSRSGC